ncbi:hypothetical protein [Solicola sp. PLA-1-18]|uniref:hypothetical protein n=1 Tax=Solicola sp. PLA-1-18 TaxID=3380532 RepID=UPI003B7D6841
MSSRHSAPRGRGRIVAVGAVVVVVVLVVVGAVLLNRGGDDTPASSGGGSTATPSTSAPTTATPTPSAATTVPDEPDVTQPTETAGPGDDGASTGTEDPALAKMAGTWKTEDNFWVLRLTAQGTFEEDFDGVENTRSGDYVLKGTKFTLKGGDGNDNSGVLRGSDKLVFDDQVLVKQ